MRGDLQVGGPATIGVEGKPVDAAVKVTRQSVVAVGTGTSTQGNQKVRGDGSPPLRNTRSVTHAFTTCLGVMDTA
jgi:hypothetical protein